MTFLTELSRLSEAATQGGWAVNNLHRPVPQACLMSYVCGPFDDSKDCVSVGSENASDHHLIALLANRRREILALYMAAQELESWLGKVVGSDDDAQVEIVATDIGAEGTCERLQRLKLALAALDQPQEDKP